MSIVSLFSSSLDKPISLPPMPVPDTLKGIDDLIHAGLEAYRNSCFNWLLAATGLVVIGLVLEGPELWHEITAIVRNKRFSNRFHFALPEHRPSDWMKLAAFVGWLFIVVGVAGEYVADSFVSKADGFVQTFDEILLAEAQQRTAFASQRASAAYERAATTEREAAQENARAANAERQAQEESARAAKALEAAETARKNAEGFQLQIAQANERAAQADQRSAEANLALAKLRTPRNLSADQIKNVVSKIKAFSGTPYDLYVSTDSDSTGIMEQIDTALHSAQWKFNKPDPEGIIQMLFADKAGIIIVSGISIHVPIEHPEWEKAVLTLGNAINAEGIPVALIRDTAESEKDKKRDRVHLMIGSKPLN